jgi:hypothetical protein
MLDEKILESLARRGIRTAYHFIGLSYLPNMFRRGGLWCAGCLRAWGNEFDDDPYKWGTYEKGVAFSGFLSCSVNPPMGMMAKSKRPVILELESTVAAMPGVVFIGKWSSFKDVVPDVSLAQTGVEWFDRMFLSSWASRGNPHPGEFLVPRHVPLSSVQRLVFFSDDDLKQARSDLSGLTLPQGTRSIRSSINPSLFGRKMQEEEQ